MPAIPTVQQKLNLGNLGHGSPRAPLVK